MGPRVRGLACAVTGTPRVSVLTCCYNASRWLREAIDSVLSQTFDDFEFILMDDGSTDDTWSIVQQYRETDRRIVAVSKKHSGLTESLNMGMALARGEWIARLDSDDVAAPDRLALQMACIAQRDDVVLVGSGSVEIDANGCAVKETRYPTSHSRLLAHLRRLKRFFPHSSALIRHASAREVGFYNERFRKSQDWDLWLRLAEVGQIACLQQSLVKIRRHPQQISTAPTGIPQWVYGTAATTCHFLRLHGAADPSSGGEDEGWLEFLHWIQHRLAELTVLERRKAWAEVRAAVLSGQDSLSAGLDFARFLSKPSHLASFLQEMTIGSWLPQRLAEAWVERPCAAS